MADLTNFDPNSTGNPDNNIFGLPFSESESKLVIVTVPWEVTVSYGAGTARAPEHVLDASYQIDLFDDVTPDAWKQGIFMRPPSKKILMKSDYLRKEAELYIDFISTGGNPNENKFMCRSLKEINEGGAMVNDYVYEQTQELIAQGKLVGLLGGDHSTPLGFWKAQAEKHGKFGILQIDAHCDLRVAYQDFTYSHASVTYNGLREIPNIERVVQVGLRDYSQGEWNYITESGYRVIAYTDKAIKTRLFEGETWKNICADIVNNLPEKVHISYDVDGLDPKLCPATGTPVPGGLAAEQVQYLFKAIMNSGRKIIGFDLVEIGVSENNWDANVGGRELWKLCNLLLASNA